MSKIPVFDIGDTLFPTVKFFRESVMEEADTEEFRIGNFNIFEPESSEKYFADKGVEIDGEKVRENLIERVKSYMKNERVEFLKRCSEEFGAIGVISDNWKFAGSFYEEMFWNHEVDFEGIIISEVVGAKKPDNQIFNAFLERRERSAENFVYFGNHGRRDAAAQKVGMDFVFTTEYDNFGTKHTGRKISELNFENVKTAVQRQ
jgi:FMN phosphatase YigB (HAD superfamily)